MDNNRPSDKPRKPKSATFQLQDLPNDRHHQQHATNPEDDGGMSATKLRPGTPAPTKGTSPDKHKMHPKSLSAFENDGDEHKHRHVVTGSKSAPVPSHGTTHTHPTTGTGTSHGHHGPSHNIAGRAATPKPQNAAAPSFKSDYLTQGAKALLEHYKNGALIPGPSRTFKEAKVQLAVVRGTLFIPTRTRPSPGICSFISTPDLGPPGADRRWVVDMKGFREDEITFTLEGCNLMIEGRQSTRPTKPAFRTETISLPINYDLDCLKVYQNKTIGNLVIAYISRSS